MHLCVYVMYLKVLWRLEESIGSPVAGVPGSCKNLMRVLGIELGFSESAASALKHQGIHSFIPDSGLFCYYEETFWHQNRLS